MGMALKGNFFTVETCNPLNDSVEYSIRLNPENIIYKAHFPGKPITPGVCLVQIALELLELYTGKTLRLSEAKNVKFVSILSPLENVVVNCTFSRMEVDAKVLKTQALVRNHKGIFAKMSLIFEKK
ncbi:MAG: beta-hydroxyacyl-ACP dehydratase [Prevotellaceae bacterium]|nr:beta-hydroxyacyl-ACP dehydratase [Prevotellaceae bacterium]